MLFIKKPLLSMFVIFYLSRLYVLNQDRSSESFTWSRMWCRESLLSTAGGNSKCLYSCMRLLTTGCSVCKSKSKFSWLIISNSENCKTSYSHCSLRASSPEYIQIPEMQPSSPSFSRPAARVPPESLLAGYSHCRDQYMQRNHKKQLFHQKQFWNVTVSQGRN